MRKVQAFFSIARFVLLNVSSTNVFDSGEDKLSTDWWRPLLACSFAVEGGSQGLACSLFPQLREPGPQQLLAGLGTLN